MEEAVAQDSANREENLRSTEAMMSIRHSKKGAVEAEMKVERL